MKRWPWVVLQPLWALYHQGMGFGVLFLGLTILSWQLPGAVGILSANWLVTNMAVVFWLRAPRIQGRWIAGSYVFSMGAITLWLSPSLGSAVAATCCGMVIFAVMAWLFRQYRPLLHMAVDRKLLLQLILAHIGIATPLGLLAGIILVTSTQSNYIFAQLLTEWIYLNLGFLLFLIPSLTISWSDVRALLAMKSASMLLGLIILSCCLSVLLAFITSSPFIFIAMSLALIAIYHTPIMVSAWTLGGLIISWWLLNQQWLLTPEFTVKMQSIEIWSASVSTVFFLQLISFLAELMNENAHRLARSEARMRGALEFAATGFALTSQQGEILEANACLCQMLGYSREELKGLTAVEISHPDDRMRSKTNLEAIRRGDIDHYEFEKRYLCKSGAVIWVYVRLSLLNYSPSQPKELILQVDNITDRKISEIELQHKETRLKLALSVANAGAWEWDLEHLQTWWADEIYHILRLSPGEISPGQESWVELIHPDDKPRVQACIQHAITHKAGYRETYRILRQDGSTAWIEDYADVEVNAAGEVCRMYGISQDVTDRTLIELAVQHSESRLRAILHGAVDAIITMDSQGRIHSFNPAAEKMFGYSTADILGENITIIIPSPHKERHQSHLERYLKTGFQHIIGKGMEILGQHKSGRLIPIDLTITEVENQGERFFTGMLRDISSHKQAEADLIAARSELQGVINAASEISIMATTREGLITLFNTGSERMLGYQANEIVGIRTPLLFHDMDEIVSQGISITRETGKAIAGFAAIINQAVRHGFDSREWTYIRKDGSRLTVLLTVTPIRDGNNMLTGFLGVAKDITPLKITQAELYRAKLQAEAASKAKSEFLANMSHEIRTPLNAVLGAAYLLENTKLDSYQHQYVNMITGAGRSLLYILNDILDFSKIEAGRMEISPAEFNLNEMLDILASIMSVNGTDKDLDLLITIHPDVPRTLIGDGMRLQQILINLTGNAIKFTHQGSVTLHITQQPGASDPLMLRFSITDTGIGMSSQQLDRLFAPFTQADNSMTRQYGGTGLGLVISKRLVELMGGTMGVESQPGSGSKFWFCLPFSPVLSVLSSPHALPAQPPLRSLQVTLLGRNTTLQASHGLVVETLGWVATARPIEPGLAAALSRDAGDIMLISEPLSPQEAQWLLAAVEQRPDMIWIVVTRLQHKATLLDPRLVPKLAAILVQPLTPTSLYNAVQEALGRRHDNSGLGVEPCAPPAPTALLAGAVMLLVEDNEINQIVASRILAQEGVRVDIVNNGQEAVARLQEDNPYDLILMDVQMPVMDGYTATRVLRQELGITTPILAMTAGVMSNEQEECRRCGMDDIIAKPLDVQPMLACLQRHLHPERLAVLQGGAVSPAPLPADDGPFNLAILRRTLGDDEPLMASLFRQFQHETQSFKTRFDASLAAQDHEDMARLLHTLKGHAGTFGAVQLASLCQQIENDVAAGSPPDQAGLLPELWSALLCLQHAMSQWLSDYRGPILDAAALDDQLLQARLSRLLVLLESRNLSALDLFDELRGVLQQRFSLPALDELNTAMEVLDFQRAAQLLDSFIPQDEESLPTK